MNKYKKRGNSKVINYLIIKLSIKLNEVNLIDENEIDSY